jgi:hypothetical protein
MVTHTATDHRLPITDHCRLQNNGLYPSACGAAGTPLPYPLRADPMACIH